MKEPNHYSDEDFQNYFDSTFTGNSSFFESHVQECQLCNKKFKAYSAVWSFAKNNSKTEPLRIDLAYSVANKVFSIKENKYFFEKIMYGILICMGTVCLILCLRFIFSSSIPSSFILFMLPVCLLLWLNYKEIKIIQKKFALYA